MDEHGSQLARPVEHVIELVRILAPHVGERERREFRGDGRVERRHRKANRYMIAVFVARIITAVGICTLMTAC